VAPLRADSRIKWFGHVTADSSIEEPKKSGALSFQ
jgi:hypothetical protein